MAIGSTPKFRFYVNQENVFKVTEDDDICIEETIEVQRLIYCHSESLDFHRAVIVIENCELACLQHYFDGQEHEVKSTVPHGNAKLKRSQKPYIRTKKSVLEKIKKSSLPPKQTISAIIKNGGGIENIRGPFDIPKNRQVSNIRHHAQTNQYTIIEITDLAQMEKGTSEEFIKDVNLVPELSVFVASNQQLKDIERFYTKVSSFSILGIDPTYNIGNYYVTVTTYRHLLFETSEGVNPVLLGPCLIRSGREYNSYYKLPESLVKANQKCRNILVFGTDAEKNVYQVF